MAELLDMTIGRRLIVNESCLTYMVLEEEDWTDSCIQLPAFLDHMKLWKVVMTKLTQHCDVTPLHDAVTAWKTVMDQLTSLRFRTPPHDAFPYRVCALQRRRRRQLLAPLQLTRSVRRNLRDQFDSST